MHPPALYQGIRNCRQQAPLPYGLLLSVLSVEAALLSEALPSVRRMMPPSQQMIYALAQV